MNSYKLLQERADSLVKAGKYRDYNSDLLLTKFEVRTVSFRQSFFRSDLCFVGLSISCSAAFEQLLDFGATFEQLLEKIGATLILSNFSRKLEQLFEKIGATF